MYFYVVFGVDFVFVYIGKMEIGGQGDSFLVVWLYFVYQLNYVVVCEFKFGLFQCGQLWSVLFVGLYGQFIVSLGCCSCYYFVLDVGRKVRQILQDGLGVVVVVEVL